MSKVESHVVDVVEVVDGRTVDVMANNIRERVILAGIGFPASDDKALYDSHKIVEEVALGKRLYMDIHKNVEGVKYVSLRSGNGDCLNEMMLKRGFARYVSTGVGFIAPLIAKESEARAERVGIWDPNRSLFKHITDDYQSDESLLEGAASTIDSVDDD